MSGIAAHEHNRRTNWFRWQQPIKALIAGLSSASQWRWTWPCMVKSPCSIRHWLPLSAVSRDFGALQPLGKPSGLNTSEDEATVNTRLAGGKNHNAVVRFWNLHRFCNYPAVFGVIPILNETISSKTTGIQNKLINKNGENFDIFSAY